MSKHLYTCIVLMYLMIHLITLIEINVGQSFSHLIYKNWMEEEEIDLFNGFFSAITSFSQHFLKHNNNKIRKIEFSEYILRSITISEVRNIELVMLFDIDDDDYYSKDFLKGIKKIINENISIEKWNGYSYNNKEQCKLNEEIESIIKEWLRIKILNGEYNNTTASLFNFFGVDKPVYFMLK